MPYAILPPSLIIHTISVDAKHRERRSRLAYSFAFIPNFSVAVNTFTARAERDSGTIT